MTVYYPTNRYNVLDMLTRSVVHPLVEGDKYYRDLLSLSPVSFPLVNSPISPDLSAWLAEEGEASFPVLIELGDLNSDLSFGDNGVAWFSGAMPIVSPVLHFPTSDTRDEFMARTYKNIDLSLLSNEVSPELFDGEIELDVIVQSLSQGTDAASPSPTVDLADRLCGAAIMSFNAASDIDSAAAAANALNSLLEFSADIDSLMALMMGLLGEIGQEEVKVVEWVCSVLSEDPESIREGRVSFVDRLEEDLDSSDPDLLRNLERLRSILSGDAAFEGFRSGGGLAVVKALLLFLIRPEPEDVTTWLKEDTGASPRILAVAAAFSGVARGYKGIAPACRGNAAMQAFAARANSDIVNRTVASPSEYAGSGAVKSTVRGRSGATEIVIKRGRTVLGERTVDEPGLRGHLLRQEHLIGSDGESALRISRVLKWDNAVNTVVEAERFKVQPGDRGVQIIFSGRPVLREEIVTDAFKKRLANAANSEVEHAARAHLDEAEAMSAPPEGQTDLGI